METDNKYLNGALRILNGKYKDAVIVLQAKEEFVIGRDVKQCNFILEAPWVSRVHCTISYDQNEQQYIVTDHSENGTFVQNGERLPRKIAQNVSVGSVIEIGEGRIQLQML